ncbi:hypothetical protein O6H91_15G080700 [Diphasiastrum complanatum]|uniref:Uncharacterized protein n=2 Tax=Diphasiastrum complanatum TaxID=34168 RepID=A0ACC2BKA9_DIPCM|nr:hypothetical protein O6H91_15G080700 [Diphasiastrum complanatum]KAJ7530138.1 hypothetical protein O6H91_15G080700 [Diphasiastrum complanatum]
MAAATLSCVPLETLASAFQGQYSENSSVLGFSRRCMGDDSYCSLRLKKVCCHPSFGKAHTVLCLRYRKATCSLSYTKGLTAKVLTSMLRKAESRGMKAASFMHSFQSSDTTAEQHSEQPYGVPEIKVPKHWDVVGLGQAMVDFSGIVGDDIIQKLALTKGTRKIVNHEERGKVLRALDGCSYKLSAGGSLSNTLVALSRLGMTREPSLNVAMTGSVGSDPLGGFYRTKLLRANVHFLSKPINNGTTGTVIVLTTPDAQRTMLSYQGMSSVVNFDKTLEEAVARSKILVIEGYLWDIPETIEAISKACKRARDEGVLVALTASDVSCVSRHRRQFWDVMAESADILFMNGEEAKSLCGFGTYTNAAFAAQHLSKFCRVVSVTDGARGSYFGLKGEVVYISPAVCAAVDTCGAGDAYAAGVLYGLLCGVPDLKGIGNLAARVAAVVVGQQGTRLKEEDALELAASVTCVSSSVDQGVSQVMGAYAEGNSIKLHLFD